MSVYIKEENIRQLTKLLRYLFYTYVLFLALVSALTVLVVVRFWFKHEIVFNHAWLLTVLSFFISSSLVFFGAHRMRKSLLEGGPEQALLLGAQLLDESPSVFKEKQLLNVVQELSIACQRPVPLLFVLRNEQGINAMTSGLNRFDACITITQGALDTLERDELQAVLAHEMAHMQNDDLMLHFEMTSFVHGLRIISDAGWYLNSRTLKVRDFRLSFLLLMMGLFLRLLGALGVLGGQLIKAFIGRKRELLADANSVLITRTKDPLIRVFNKLALNKKYSNIQHHLAKTFEHCFFQTFSKHENMWFRSHPSLIERIKAIDSNAKLDLSLWEKKTNVKDEKSILSHHTSFTMLGQASLQKHLDARQKQIGQFFEHLPSQYQLLCTSRDSFMLVIYATLIANQHEKSKFTFLRNKIPQDKWATFETCHEWVQTLQSHNHLRIIQLCLYQVKRLNGASLSEFLKTMLELIHLDQKVSPYELALSFMIKKSLQKQNPIKHKYDNPRDLQNEINHLISLLFYTSASDKNIGNLITLIKKQFDFFNLLAKQDLRFDGFEENLNKMSSASKQIRYQFLEVCYLCVYHDSMMHEKEELLLSVYEQFLMD